MDLTPPPVISPKSPSQYRSNSRSLYEYPSPAQSDSHLKSTTDSLQDIGLYSCSMAGPNCGSASHDQSSTATNNWEVSRLQRQNITGSSPSTTPNILSAEFDPFAPFHHQAPATYSHDIYSAQPAEVAVLPPSPLPSNTSQRSSFSPAPHSEMCSQPGSFHSFTPRIKMEDQAEYLNSSENMMLSSPQLGPSLLVSSASSYPGSVEENFYPNPNIMGWPKAEYSSIHDRSSNLSLPLASYERRSRSQDRGSSGSQGQRRTSGAVSRTRQPRKLTTKEDANFQCSIKGCGKLFGRSYNLKAHLETHDSSREYPFPCVEKDCTKRFVRKTDLQRHHQSVHMKQRNHRCDYCNRHFARKDTLRRHMEDGCSKRFDIETVDVAPQNYSNGQTSLRTPSRSEAQWRQPSHVVPHYSSSSDGRRPQNAPLTSAPGPYLERHDYMTDDHNQGSVWPQ